MATQILAELGAEVIKIERPGTGDESRSFEPSLPRGESAYFFAFNRGKSSMTLDLKTPRGQEIARRWRPARTSWSRTSCPARWTSSASATPSASAKPGLVYVSNTGFGQTGPDRDRKGYDTIFQALSGVMALTGPGRPAGEGRLPVADLTSGSGSPSPS